jgi:hypothetical protein
LFILENAEGSIGQSDDGDPESDELIKDIISYQGDIEVHCIGEYQNHAQLLNANEARSAWKQPKNIQWLRTTEHDHSLNHIIGLAAPLL